MGDQSGPARFLPLFESALQAYEKKTGIALAEHPFAVQLQSCHSVESVIVVLKGQAKVFSEFTGSDRILKSIKSIVSISTTLSATALLGDALDLPLPPTKAIQGGLAILLAAANGVSSSCDALVDFLESIERFLHRLEIYARIPPTPIMDEIVMKIMMEVLFTLALATKELKQGRSIKYVKKVLGEKEVEAVLQRLNRLTHDEARNTAVQTLEIVYGLVQNLKVIMEDGKSSIDGVLEALEILHEIASEINKSKRDKLHQDIRNWLTPPDPWKNHNVAHGSRHSDTGAWFAQGNVLPEWKASGPSSLLWIHGKPGAGKSVLCSTIIEEIQTMRKSGLASLAIFYCDFREDQKRSLRGFVSSVLVQLCRQYDSYSVILSKFYAEHENGSRAPSDDSLVRCLKDILKLSGQAPIFLIVDALDECPNTSALYSPRDKVLILLEDLIDSQLPNLRICVTSRPEADIKPILEPLAFYSVSLHDESGQMEDIKNYIKSVVNTNRNMRRWKPEQKQLVIDVLTERADGMFRWAVCQLDFLGKCLPGRIQHALNELPETLDETYERILREIDTTNWEFARRLFQCVAVVSRPLQVEELAEFLAFDFQAGPIPKFREDWRLEDPLEAVLSTCSTLLALVNVENSQVIQFSHFSVKEFLTSSRFAEKHDTVSHRYHVSMTPAHTVAAQACLGILLHLDENVTNDSLKKFPLVKYAAEHWFQHARFEEVWQNVDEGMKQIFDPRKPHLAVWTWIHDPIQPGGYREGSHRGERPLPPPGNLLHHAAFCGLHSIVKFLIIERSEDVHSRDTYNKSTPLHWASLQGDVEVACVLIEHGADVTAQDIYGSTPLHFASQAGHLDLARFLVMHGADAIAQDNGELTPLHMALQSFRESVDLARFLVEQGADVTAKDKDGSTPLHWAPNVDLARFLVEHGADVRAKNNDRETPLHHASGSFLRRVDLAQFLVEQGADVMAQDKDGSTPLHLVSTLPRGHMDMARFLVEQGADVNAQKIDGSTSLHWASVSGNIDPTRFLIQLGADPTVQDKDGRTSLHYSSRSYRRSVDLARIFVEHGVDVTVRDKDCSTPLHWASHRGDVNLARFLVEHGADVTARYKDGSTPLHWSLQRSHVDMARFLVEHGADTTAQEKDGSTPLHRASLGGHVNLVRLLVEHGADATAQDKDSSTPLHKASQSFPENVDLARFLVEHGGDTAAQDKHGQTPLYWALTSGHEDLARFLVEHGTDATVQDEHGSTPLHQASRRGHVDLSRFLIENGADATAQDKHGSTPLHEASQSFRENADLAWFLVEHGANVTVQDEHGSTPLHHAAKNGDMNMARFLVEQGADVTVQDKHGSTPLHYAAKYGDMDMARFLFEQGADVTAQDWHGLTPLHQASQSFLGDGDLGRFFVKHGADVTVQDEDQLTPLHLASSCGDFHLAQFFIEHGADVTAQDRHGLTPLHLASLRGHVNLAWLLVECGANATAQDKHGSTPLHRASLGGYVELARLLVELGVDTTVQDNYGSTPLHWASRLPRGSMNLVRFLVDHGADVTAQDKDGSTPLHQASQDDRVDFTRFVVDATDKDYFGWSLEHPALSDGNVDLAQFLVEHGADVTARDKDGSTPLHWASRSSEGNAVLARFLIKRGASTTAQDKDGLTPLHLASLNGCQGFTRGQGEAGEPSWYSFWDRYTM